MKKLQLAQSYPARVYLAGKARGQSVEVSLEDGQILLATEGGEQEASNADDWDLKLGGTDETKAILENPSSGTSIFCDIAFLDALSQAQDCPNLSATARHLKKQGLGRSFKRSSGLMFICVMVVLFLIWVGVGFSYMFTHHEAKSGASEGSSTSTDNTAADDRQSGEKTGGQPGERHGKRGGALAPGEAYIQEVNQKIKSCWNPKHSGASKKAVLAFTVHKDGKISKIVVKESSGSGEFDREARATLKAAEPLPAVPASLEPPVTVEFTFDYKVHGRPEE